MLMDLLLVVGATLFVIFFFGFCIFIHELGHFLAAKWRGMHIVAFSIGFRKVWAWKHNGIEYRIGCIPCGGYVDLPQIDSSAEKKVVDGIELPHARPIDRMITAFAGPLFNILFGLLLGIAIWYYGVPRVTPKMSEIAVESVEEGSPEYMAGLRPGDVVVKLNGRGFYTSWERFVSQIVFTVGDVRLTVKRGDTMVDISYIPAENPNYFGREAIAYPFFKPVIPLTLHPRSGSPAEIAGIRSGDILISLNGRKTSDISDLNSVLALSPETGAVMEVRRDGKLMTFAGIIPHRQPVPDSYRIGIVFSPTDTPGVVLQVVSGSPAERAGIRPGDRITAIGGARLVAAEQIPGFISDSRGREISVDVLRDGRPEVLKVTPQPHVVYDIGIRMIVWEHPTPFQQLYDVVSMTYNSLRGVGYRLANRAGLSEKTSTLKPRNFSGPIGIVSMIFKSVYYGSIMEGIFLIVLISFSLGLLNLMPLPILDGGHIVLAALEMIMRRPLPSGILRPINVAFIVFLISFMIYVSYYDVDRLIPERLRSVPESRELQKESADHAAENNP